MRQLAGLPISWAPLDPFRAQPRAQVRSWLELPWGKGMFIFLPWGRRQLSQWACLDLCLAASISCTQDIGLHPEIHFCENTDMTHCNELLMRANILDMVTKEVKYWSYMMPCHHHINIHNTHNQYFIFSHYALGLFQKLELSIMGQLSFWIYTTLMA